jgi:hypothetical protein
MTTGKEIINYNDDLYLVEKSWKESAVKPDKIDELKQLLEYDIVLRKNGRLYFCTKVQDGEIVTEESIVN